MVAYVCVLFLVVGKKLTLLDSSYFSAFHSFPTISMYYFYLFLFFWKSVCVCVCVCVYVCEVCITLIIEKHKHKRRTLGQ